MSNTLGIGGMTVEGNATLDRSTYDTNEFYFYMPKTSDGDITVLFQSSTDYYYTETQGWALQATKSGDGYDVTGQWIGEYPTDNYYYHPTIDCWQGGDFWPNAYDDSDETVTWNLTGRLTPDSAIWTIDQTWITKSDGITWHLVVAFEGSADTNAPRLVTSEAAPTTDAVATAVEDPEDGDDSGEDSSSSDSASATSSGQSSATGAADSSATDSSSASATSSASGSSSTNSGAKTLVDVGSMAGLIAVAAGLASIL
jgi:hypothetical protein